MIKVSLLGAAAILLLSALAGPAKAQQVISNPGYCAQFYPNANCQNTGPGNPYTGNYQRRAAYGYNSGYNSYNAYNRWDGDRRSIDSGFWPGGVAGATAGTAGAMIGAAPRSEVYARQNGFVCRPGTWFRGEDGRRYLCQ